MHFEFISWDIAYFPVTKIWYLRKIESSHFIYFSALQLLTFILTLCSLFSISFLYWKVKVKVTQSWFLVSPWNSPGQNTGVSSHSLLQGIFPSQGSNTGLLHCRQIPYELSHQGRPRILEWVAYPFSSRSSWPRNWTGVSCIAGGFFISWATFLPGVIANQSPHKNAHLLLRVQARRKSRDDHWMDKI